MLVRRWLVGTKHLLASRSGPRSNLKWFKTDRRPNKRHTDARLSDFHYSVTNRWQASNTHVLFFFLSLSSSFVSQFLPHCNHPARKTDGTSQSPRHPSVSIRRRHISCVRRLCLELILVARGLKRLKTGSMGASWLERHLCAPFVLSLRQRWWESGDWRSTRLRANWEMKTDVSPRVSENQYREGWEKKQRWEKFLTQNVNNRPTVNEQQDNQT